MYVSCLYFFVFLLSALFQSIIASRLETVESRAPAVPTTVTRYRLIGTYSPTSCEPSPRGFGHIAPTSVPTTLPVLMPTTSDSSMLASYWAMFMPCSGKLLALFLLAAFVVVASRSFAISGRYCNSRTICAQHFSINIIKPAESVPVEVATPVSVEHVETTAAAESAEVAATVEVAAPTPVEVTTPVSVEVTASVSVEVAEPAPVKVAEHAELVVGANTAESAMTTPLAIVFMAIYRTTACTPSGRTPSPYTAWTAGRNTQRKTSSDVPCVVPATARPVTRTTSAKSALLCDTKSTSDMTEKLALSPSKFVESTPRMPSGRIPGRTVVTPGCTEAEKAAAMRAEAARAAAVRVRARQTAANNQTRRTKAHHS